MTTLRAATRAPAPVGHPGSKARRRLRHRRAQLVTALAAALACAGGVVSGVSPGNAVASWASSPQQAAGHALAAPATDDSPRLYTVIGTPHTWLMDDQGVLHWVGDSIALARTLYPAREYTLDEPLDPQTQRSLAGPIAIHYSDVLATPRGAPLLSTSFVRGGGGEVYYPRWDALGGDPVMLRVTRPEDLEVLGVEPTRAGGQVVPSQDWEAQYHKRFDRLRHQDMRPLAPEQAGSLPCMPEVREARPQPNGAVADVVNPCESPLQVRLSAVLYTQQDGQPLATTSTAVFIAPPGVLQVVALNAAPARMPRSRGASAQPAPVITAGYVQTMLSAGPPPPEPPPDPFANMDTAPPTIDQIRDFVAQQMPPPPPPLCVDAGAEGCLRTDPGLLPAVRVLQGLDVGRQLLENAASFGVTLRQTQLFDALGSYNSETRTVSITRQLDEDSDWERAAVLAHELQHAVQHSSGRLLMGRGSAACLAFEQEAFAVGAHVWTELWHGSLPEPRDRTQRDLNDMVQAAADPSTHAKDLAPRYVGECA